MNSTQLITCLSSSSHIRFIFYLFVVFLSSTSIVISISYSGGNDTDHQALLKIKSMITQQHPGGVVTSWNSTLHFCDWTGVTCGKKHKRVTYLSLRSQGVEGSLSPYVGNLSFLRVLDLANNSFHGAIPHELSRLSRLHVLALDFNNFSAVIPSNISSCSKLEVLSLTGNNLVGSIPKELSFLPKLNFVSLALNKLTGGITPFLGNITSMQIFSVAKNQFGGSIPDTLGNWKLLRKIHCGSCDLYGTIPRSLYNLSLLTEISFSKNHLIGSLPPAIGEMLPHLVILQLWDNQLTGPLPPSISNCSRLQDLEMGINKFSGKLAIDFSKLRDINIISLYSNPIGSNEIDAMKFIDSLKNCTRLEMLLLSNCKFQGVLPTSVGNLSNQLRYLYLNKNHLYGSLPRSIGYLVGLEILSVGGNRFIGNIPSTIGNLRNLEAMYLVNNQLSGQIPQTIGNLSSLITLALHSNMLEGGIPSSLGNCQRLLELYLNDNKLNANIPKQIFQVSSLSKTLDLSHNNLFGSLPTEIGDLIMLSALDLSYNNLSGNIPNTLGGCASLSWLYMKDNLFQGMIPPSLRSLKGLVELDISQNNLSGKIPKFLEQFKLFRYLNLSYNDFEGEVPMLGVFANTSAFSILGNTRLCGGFVELGLPKCIEIKKHSKRFPLFVIAILLACTLFIIACLAYAWNKKKRKNQASQSSQSSIRERLVKVSYNQLLKATDAFSEANLIGSGGFSSVYKGTLDEGDDKLVAIKVLHLQNRGAQRSFLRECEAWRNIRHRNLLKIITSCSSVDFQGNDFKALVYEFMPNGSLDNWLHTSSSTFRLNLLQRINILIDIACALDYIHNQCVPSIVHGDLKPSNILLDDDMVAHVGDFGLAKFLGTTSYQNSSTQIRGTIGYAPPEYGLGSEMTCSGDVYTYGILLLEVMTRKKPTDYIFNEVLSLHKFASMALLDHVTDVIDDNILNIYEEDENFVQNKEANAMKIEKCLASTIKIGLSCSMDSPSQRVDIKKVVHELQHIRVTLQNI